jgi:membrane protease YdiL (CAAX protease family)
MVFRWQELHLWQESALLKDLGKILLYFAAVIVLGALLAPPLFWLGRAVAGTGTLKFLADTDFQKFFNRSMLIAAFALLWPMIRWLHIGGVGELGLQPDARWKQRLGAGFIISGLCVAILAGCYIAAEVYRWKKALPWGKVPPLLLSASVVALLEEALFRGGILGLFRRTMRPLGAIVATSAIFSAVHFLKPDDSVQIESVHWLSGFGLIPHVFHQFAEPLLVLGQFTTIFVLGLMLADVTVRTRSLWMAIGLHAGVVFVKMSFSKFTKREWEQLPWIGKELQIGLVSVFVLLVAWALARVYLRYVDSRNTA